MNSIFGRINFNGKPIDKTLFNNSANSLNIPVELQEKIKIKNHWGLFPSTEIPKSSNNFNIVSDSILYNKEELIQKLNILNNYSSDEDIILKAFETWGKDCVNFFIGDFSFAIWNSENNELFCARDHIGIKPFNYYYKNDCFVFSSNIIGITSQTDINLNIDEQYIADTISIIKSAHFRTTFKEIHKLPPAHYLSLKNNKLEIKQYWELKPQKTLSKNNEEIIAEFKSLLIESVKCRIKNQNSIGAELSGGLDSSSITAIASQFKQLKTFSHVLPDNLLGKIHPFKDEREYINILADHRKISNRYFVKSENESLIDILLQNVTELSCITQQGFGVFSDQLYQTAKQEGVSVLLSGFGGDEVVSSKSLRYLKELAVHQKWNEIKDDLKNQELKKSSYLKLLIKYYLKSKIPFISEINFNNSRKKSIRKERFRNLAINSSFNKNYKIKNRFLSNFQKSNSSSLQERNIERITHSHVSQRLEYCSLIARKYGIEYRYPLLDIRLIEYYLAMPARLKARNGIGRHAIREAIEGIVPKEIQWRNDKSGATIPTVFMRMINDKERIEEIIKESRSNKIIKKYVDLDKYEQWFEKLCKRSEGIQKNINPGAFYNYLKLILFINQNPSLFK
jgi:asparagine synthase (glutamine-hydrolysing)